MRGVGIATAMIAGSVLVGCAGGTQNVQRYPEPVFTTRPAPSPPPVPPYPAPPTAQRGEPGWIPPRGVSNRWTDIIIHHSAGPSGGARAFDAYHRNVRHWDELGYHFVIGNGTDTGDGQIEVGSRWTKQKHGAHCKTPDNYYNDHGIGICLVGDFDRTSPTPSQIAALNRLLAFLTATCGIPHSRISTHGAITRQTQCPGRRFSLADVKRRLAQPSPLTYGK